MIEEHLRGVEFISVNTDAQALTTSQVRRQGPDRQEADARTRRRRAAGDRPPGDRGEPRGGRRASSRAPTWSSSPAAWAAAPAPARRPIIAQMARDIGALTVGIVTKPFLFEGRKRMRQAEMGITEMRNNVDTMIVVPNERLLAVVGKGIPVPGRAQEGRRGAAARHPGHRRPDHHAPASSTWTSPTSGPSCRTAARR